MAKANKTHETIRIRFSVNGRQYEAVGFLREEEISCSGDEMLARTKGENGGAVGDEDEAILCKYHAELPAKLRPYYLVTGRRCPGSPRYVSYFDWYGDGWYQCWDWLDRPWYGRNLVVRRCA